MFAVRISVNGEVQGVGFRDFTVREAEVRGIAGYVKNLPDGSVMAIAEGEEGQVRDFINTLKKGPPMARVRTVEVEELTPTGNFPSFAVH
ncbi:MAG: acylphosphatase [Dehalogenimonas sp.]